MFFVHPILVHFPVGLWLVSFLFDLMYAWRRDARYALAAFWLIGLGLLGALASIASGWVDYLRLRPGLESDPGRLVVIHQILGYAATGVYFTIFMLRRRSPERPSRISMLLGISAAVLVGLGAWYGTIIRNRV